MVNNHETYMAWWEDTARKYKAINHDPLTNLAFVRVVDSSRSPFQPYYYTNEFFEEMRELNFPCLIAESTSARFDYQQGVFGDFKGGIVVIDETDGNTDFDSINKAVSACEIHCKKLVGYLQKYLKEQFPSVGKLLSSSIIIHPIGPVGDKYFGARAEFTIKAHDCGFEYDVRDWDDE